MVSLNKQKSERHYLKLVSFQIAVTCLAASPAYNIIVSGSRDGTAIVWDMSRYIFVRQLRDHVGLVAAVAINDLTGNIATCSATFLHLWSINGDCLATVNTSIGSADRMQQILCVAFSMTREWDSQNVIITGSTDGVVRVRFTFKIVLLLFPNIFMSRQMWSMDYVQIPEERSEAEESPEDVIEESKEVLIEKKKAELVKQMSLSTDGAGETLKDACIGDTEAFFLFKVLAKSGSESSISEACDSIKESKKQFEDEKEECSDKEESRSNKNQLTIDNKASISSAKSMTQLKDVGEGVKRRSGDGIRRRETKLRSVSHIEKSVDDLDDFEDVACGPEKGIRPSKSDTSLTESFVMVDNDGGGRRLSNKQNILRDGECLQLKNTSCTV